MYGKTKVGALYKGSRRGFSYKGGGVYLRLFCCFVKALG